MQAGESQPIRDLEHIQLRLNIVASVAKQIQSQPEMNHAIDAKNLISALNRSQFYMMEREELKKDLRWLYRYLMKAEYQVMTQEYLLARRLFDGIIEVL